MIKIILNSLLIMLFLTCNTQASFSTPKSTEWKHVRTLGDYQVYHKETYTHIVNVRGKKHITTWAKYVARDTKPNMLYLKKDDYVLVQLQFDCQANKYAILSGTTYLSQGRFSRSSLVDKPFFSTIQPKSVESRIATNLCNKYMA